MIDSKMISDLFKRQLENIKNKELRKKVVEVWVEGCRRGNWKKVDELKKIPFSLLTESRGINLIEHTMAVTEMAVEMAKAQIRSYSKMVYEINIDYLYAGGLLHDVGKLIEIESDGKGGYRKSRAGKLTRHPISGAILAAECGVPEEVINIIACHSKEGEGRPQVVETIFIHQADFATFNPLVLKEKGLLIE